MGIPVRCGLVEVGKWDLVGECVCVCAAPLGAIGEIISLFTQQ